MTGLLPPAAQVAFLPLLAAAILAAIPAWRIAAWGNFAACVLALLLACRLPFLPAHQSWLYADGLAVHLTILTCIVAVSAAWFSLFYMRHEVAAGRITRRGLRLYHPLFQAFLGFMLLAFLSDNTGITWVAVEAATLAAVIIVGLPGTAEAIEASWKFFILCGVAIALALFGTVVLYLAASPVLGAGWDAMRWSALAGAAPRLNGALLNLAFVFLLIGYGTKAGLAPLHLWMPDAHSEGPTPVSAVLSGSMLNVALFVLLRLRGVMGANAAAGGGGIPPGPPLLALGLLSVLLAAFALWQRRDVKRFFAFSTIEHMGIATFAFGLGGPVATFAGLLHVTLHTLAKAAVFTCTGLAAQSKGAQTFQAIGGLIGSQRRLGLGLAAAILAVAGPPPFGLFSSEFLIATQTIQRMPWLALPLGLGVVTGGWALLSRLQMLCTGTPMRDLAPPPSSLALWPVWLQLAAVVVLGLAMPQALGSWMHAIAATGATP